jgi:hypothetical protein
MSREILEVASGQGVVAEGPFDGVDEATDSMINNAKILVGACWPDYE